MDGDKKKLFIYTMTSALGDYLIFGSLIKAIERYGQTECLVLHRANKHVDLWPHGNSQDYFFNVFSIKQLALFLLALRRYQKKGYEIFGIQMFPGSIQGFLLFSFLKLLRLLHFRVDFNLINADIITPTQGGYIYDIHLNQAATLLATSFPPRAYRLDLPLQLSHVDHDPARGRKIIALHPWSRRGEVASFTWSTAQWTELISFIVSDLQGTVLLFGKDAGFDNFQSHLKETLCEYVERIQFAPSSTVPQLIDSIRMADLLICPNTSVAHIGKAVGKKMIILAGPSLPSWSPSGAGIHVVTDDTALFPGNDRPIDDFRFPSIRRIPVAKICKLVAEIHGNVDENSLSCPAGHQHSPR